MKTRFVLLILATALLLISGCGEEKAVITDLSQLSGKTIAVPTGTMADELVLSVFPDVNFQYYNSVLDCALAVKQGQADAAAYDEPLLKNIAAKNPGMKVLPGLITEDDYGIAVALDNAQLKVVIDEVVNELKANGTYDDMMERWLPAAGEPASMPELQLAGTNGILRLGTAAITEPFSFIDGSQAVVGLDIEIAAYVAKELGMELEVVNMDFGGLIPALISGKVDMIAACITISEERAKSVLFSEPYYRGGIAALVKE